MHKEHRPLCSLTAPPIIILAALLEQHHVFAHARVQPRQHTRKYSLAQPGIGPLYTASNRPARRYRSTIIEIHLRCSNLSNSSSDKLLSFEMSHLSILLLGDPVCCSQSCIGKNAQMLVAQAPAMTGVPAQSVSSCLFISWTFIARCGRDDPNTSLEWLYLQRVGFVRWTLGFTLHRSRGVVAHPAYQSQLLGLINSVLAEKHPLHLDTQTHIDVVSWGASSESST